MTPIDIDQKVFQPLLQRALLLPLLAVLLLCAVLFWQIGRMEDFDFWVDHTDQVISTAQQELQLLIDRETATRGFALSRNELFLGPEIKARKEAPLVLDRLQTLTADNPEQQQRIQAIRETLVDWEKVRAELEREGRSQSPPDGRQLMIAKSLMDDLREQFAAFLAVEQSFRVEREHDARESRHFAIYAGLGLTLLLGTLLALFSRRQLTNLSKNYSEALRTAHDRSLDLAQLNERFSTTLHSIGDGVIATDERNYIVFMNSVAEKMTGWQADDAFARPSSEVFKIVSELTRMPVESPLDRALRKGELCYLESHTVLLARDGREISIDDSGAPIRDEKGKIRGAVLVFRDVSEQRRLEAARDLALHELRRVLDATPDGVFEINFEGRIRFINTAGAQMLDYAPEELRDQNLHNLLQHSNEDGTVRRWHQSRLLKLLLTCQSIRNENDIFWRRDRTPVPVQYSASPVMVEGSCQGAVVVFKDMSALRRTELALLRSEKLAATGQMASAMAHEINNPLESITNLVYLLQQHLSEDAVGSHYVQLADQELRRVAHIVQRTLGLYREASHAREIELPALCEEARQMYQRAIDAKHVRFGYECAEDARVYGLPNELRHLIFNLVLNAVEAAPENGTVRLRVRQTSRAGLAGTSILVADSGAGMEPQHRALIFDPFYSTKPGGGHGMGLWIVRSVVDRMNAKLLMRTATGAHSYTIFQVFIPRRAASAMIAAAGV